MPKVKILFFPVWVLLLGILAWFSAEIATFSTLINKIDLGTIIFSFSYYLVQAAIVIDIILKKRFSLWGIFLIGLIFGLLEEAFYIKNPFLLTLLLAFGHSAVTITFPYLIINFLIKEEKKPFLSKTGYILSFIYLSILYIFMAGFIHFIYPDSLLLGLLLIFIFIILKKFGKRDNSFETNIGTSIWEKIFIIIFAIFSTILTKQNYLGISTIFLWILFRQKAMSKSDIYFSTFLFLVFHFLLSFINKSVDQAKISTNYPFVLILGIVLILVLLKKRGSSINR